MPTKNLFFQKNFQDANYIGENRAFWIVWNDQLFYSNICSNYLKYRRHATRSDTRAKKRRKLAKPISLAVLRKILIVISVVPKQPEALSKAVLMHATNTARTLNAQMNLILACIAFYFYPEKERSIELTSCTFR